VSERAAIALRWALLAVPAVVLVVLVVIFWDQVLYGVSIVIGWLLLSTWWNAAHARPRIEQLDP
jgi:hypothetical protein